MKSKNNPSPPGTSGEGDHHFLLMRRVRDVVEKYGGSVKIDQGSNSAVLSIPQSKKTACFEELQEIIGNSEPLKDFFPFLN